RSLLHLVQDLLDPAPISFHDDVLHRQEAISEGVGVLLDVIQLGREVPHSLLGPLLESDHLFTKFGLPHLQLLGAEAEYLVHYRLLHGSRHVGSLLRQLEDVCADGGDGGRRVTKLVLHAIQKPSLDAVE
ncbi:unnamed protein product, partial [Ectocarpus sp. 12 AP-2014]